MCGAEGIRKTLAQYTHWVDDRRVDDLAGLFTEDASWTVMDKTVTGRSAIRNYIASWTPFEVQVKHLTMDSIIDVVGKSANAVSSFVVFYETRLGESPNGRDAMSMFCETRGSLENRPPCQQLDVLDAGLEATAVSLYRSDVAPRRTSTGRWRPK